MAEKRWLGKVAYVRTSDGREERVVALTWEAFVEAVSRPPHCLDPHTALRALAEAGCVVKQVEKRRDGSKVERLTRGLRLNGRVERCVCIPARLLGV